MTTHPILVHPAALCKRNLYISVSGGLRPRTSFAACLGAVYVDRYGPLVSSQPSIKMPVVRTLRAFALLIATAIASPLVAQSPALHSARANEWVDLNLAAEWRGYRLDTLPPTWAFDRDGVLTFTGRGGDIVTRRHFGDFELELEWRIAAGGNSGVFYRATEGTGAIYENAAEMQVLDNAAHPDGRLATTSAGSSFALYGPTRDVSRPAGEWNVARIVVRGAHVEHWLNGAKVVEYEIWSPEWKALVAASKFTAWPAYGWNTRGHIGLQDHGDTVSFRRMRIREIAP